MIKAGSEPFALQDYIQQLFLGHYDRSNRKALEAQIKSQVKNTNPHAGIGDLFLDYSPSGSYVGLSDTIAISAEAYRALQKAHHAEIDKIIERGESLELNGISYEDYSYYIACKGSFPEKSTYKLLCYEGKSRAYFTEKAIDIYDRWAEGEDFPEEELTKWTQYACDYYTKAEYRRRLNQNANRLTDALAENGFVLGKDEKLDIKLSSNATYSVSGIEDEEKRKEIEIIVNKTLDSACGLHEHFLRVPGFPKTEAESAMINKALITSRCIRTVEQYLKENTAGVTLKDLYLDAKGNICGGLPQETLDQLNNAVTVKDTDDLKNYTEEELYLARNKESMQEVLKTIETYGIDNLPQLNFYFAYSDGKLSVVDGRVK